MAWGAPTALGTAAAVVAAHSITISGVTVALNSLIVVTGFARLAVSTDAVLVTDSVGNTYTVVKIGITGAGQNASFIAWAVAASALSAGSITVADTATGATQFGRGAISAVSVSGGDPVSPEDAAVRATGTAAATTTPSLTSGTPGQVGEIFFSVYGSLTTNAGAFTEDATWTPLTTALGSASPAMTMSSAYFVNAGSGTKARAPSTASQSYAMATLGFVLASGGGGVTPVHRLTLLGAG